MTTHYISFKKYQPAKKTIRIEVAVSADTKQEARQIAEKEVRALKGYRLQGMN